MSQGNFNKEKKLHWLITNVGLWTSRIFPLRETKEVEVVTRGFRDNFDEGKKKKEPRRRRIGASRRTSRIFPFERNEED